MKWEKTSAIVIGFSHSTCMRNGHAYKEKWAIIYGDYK
jgi:hypothetical protein